MKNATAVRNPRETIAVPIRSRYTVHELPGDPGNGNRVNEGVEGLDLSRDEARDEVDEGITFSSSLLCRQGIDRIRNDEPNPPGWWRSAF